MTAGVSAISTVRSGLCPHGLSPGGCPICSGMSGGAQKVKTADFTAKPGEMSWNECAAIGAFLKSLQNARMARNADFQNRLVAMAQFEANMAKSAQQLSEFIQLMGQNSLTKPVAVLAQKLVLPVVEAMKNMPTNVLNLMAQFSGKLADISDKLAAIYGELKAATNKKISDLAKKIKKKLFSIFEIFSTDNEEDENEIMIAFEKQLNKLKEMIEKISYQATKEDENDDDA